MTRPARRPGPRPPLLRRLALTLEVLLIGVLGAALGLLVAGRHTAGVGPFEARMTLGLSTSGGTEVALPPLGELVLDTHTGPLHLGVEVVRLREDQAREYVRDPDRLVGLGEEVRRDLYAGLVRLSLQAGAVTLLGAGGLGLLVFRRPRRTLLAAGTGLATLLASAGVVWISFDERSLAQPEYRGLLAVAPSAVGDVRTIVADFGTYTRSLGKLVTNVTDLYAVTSALPTFEPAGNDVIRLLHVADLHLSPVGFEVMLSVADQFGVDAILDAGDMTDFGSGPETRYVSGLSRVDVPYVFVKGNHDSEATVAAVRAAGGIVLEPDTPVEVAGVTLLGSPDPRFTPDKSTGDDDTPVEVLEAQGEELVERIRAGVEADIAMVHDPKAAEPLRGSVPLVLSGHTHRRRAETRGGTLVLTQGSTGGAGLRGLEGAEPTPIELSVLYLDASEQRLQAYDLVTLGGLGTSSARIERRVIQRAVEAEQETEQEAVTEPSPSASP